MKPSKVIAFYPISEGVQGSPQRVIEKNKVVLNTMNIKSFPIDYLDVESVFRILSEMVMPYLDKWSVNIIPLGPKTHTLACVLLSQKFPEISCLYIDADSKDPYEVDEVDANGDIAVYKIDFISLNI